MEDRKLTNEEVGRKIFKEGLGKTIDALIEPKDIEDTKLAVLWYQAQLTMNEIQLYLELSLGEDFFNGSN
jgi:hypothetical protein